MRFSLAVAVILAGISVSGWAQQNNQFKVRVTHEKPAKQSAPLTKQSAGNTAASADAKALQNVERQSGKGLGHSAAAKPTKAPALKPVKDKPSPPMNFNGTGGGSVKGGGRGGQTNPYKGRLKQKGGGSGHQ